MKRLVVVWNDTGGHPGWFDKNEMDRWLKASEEDYSVISIGFLYAENDKHLVLIRGWNGLGQYMDPIRINKEAVTSVEEWEHGEHEGNVGNEEQERAREESGEASSDGKQGNTSDYDSGVGGRGYL